MKQTIKILAVALVIAAFAFIPPKKSMVGNWVIHYGNDQKITLDFSKNGTVKVAIPAEQFTVEGKYKLKGDILYLNDGTCGLNYWAKYKETFLNNDSVYSVAIEDSCMPRKSSMDKATLIKVKM